MAWGALEYVPQYFNNVNSTSPTLSAEPVTGLPIGTGSLRGLYWDVTESEAYLRSQTSTGTLHAGRYRLVQVDSAATAANVKTGTIGLMLAVGANGVNAAGVNYVTSYDKGLATGLRPVIFLNAITPGNYGVVQELGDANVLLKSSITNGAPAIGDVIVSSANGLGDDPTQSGQPTYAQAKLIIGIAESLPASNSLCRVLLESVPVVQG